MKLKLCIFALTLAVAAHAENGWQVLFDGKDLNAWRSTSGAAPAVGWKIEDGALCIKKGSKAGYIWTKDRFSDFVLELEFSTTGNSGVFIRTDKPADPVQTGIEIQVERKGGPGSRNGLASVYDCLAPSKEISAAEGWHKYVITCRDNKIEISFDGTPVVNMDLNQWTTPNKNPDGSKNKFKTALKDFKRDGHIGLQDHGAEVKYRNIRVKPLK
jgi:hypothetical protein